MSSDWGGAIEEANDKDAFYDDTRLAKKEGSGGEKETGSEGTRFGRGVHSTDCVREAVERSRFAAFGVSFHLNLKT